MPLEHNTSTEEAAGKTQPPLGAGSSATQFGAGRDLPSSPLHLGREAALAYSWRRAPAPAAAQRWGNSPAWEPSCSWWEI